jgi:hypothetical protein
MRQNDNAHDWVWLEEIPPEFGYCERCHICAHMNDVTGEDRHIKKGAKRYTLKQAVEIKRLQDKEKGD